MEEPWYKDGLHFQCTRCGHCCTGAPGFVWVNDAELADIARVRAEPLQEVIALYTRPSHRGLTLREKPNGDCVFYDRGRGCTIYQVRPRQCRTWPFWESNLATPEAWEHTRQVCPGSGTGEFVPLEEITRRMQEIRL